MSTIAKVKSVSSGDTLLLQSPNTGAEKALSLAYVSAPRLKRDGEEVSFRGPPIGGHLNLGRLSPIEPHH